MSYANSEGQDKRAHPYNLIWIFSVRPHILQCPLILLAGNVGPDQPARTRKLIRACVVRKLHKGPFSCAVHHMMIMGRAKGRSNFAYVHTDKAFRCPLTNKLDTREYTNAVNLQTLGVSRACMIRRL